MEYVLATVDVAGQERNYYAGPVRKIGGRMAHKVTHSLSHATTFATAEDAEAMCEELGGSYRAVPVEDKA
jgi:hypothetical protein